MSNLILASNKNNEVNIFSELENFNILYMDNNEIIDSIYGYLDSISNKKLNICIIESVNDFNKIKGFGSLLNSIFHCFKEVIFLFDTNDFKILESNFGINNTLIKKNEEYSNLNIFQILKSSNENYSYKKKFKYFSDNLILFKHSDINEIDFYINEIDKNNNFLSITKSINLGNCNVTFIFNDKLKIKDNLNVIKQILKTRLI